MYEHQGQAMYGTGLFRLPPFAHGFTGPETVAETHAGLDHSTGSAQAALKPSSFVIILHCVRVTGVPPVVGLSFDPLVFR